MPPTRLGPHDVLEYDARYGVLICTQCQYAIQKSALGSHLLRHKIYRDERQHLLSSIAQLDILEPHQVPLPAPTSPPIDALPIISGYRCTRVGCGNLCASSKRMRRHWSEIHGVSESFNASEGAHPVKLQTFFRGTKLRYFEVTSSVAVGTAGAAPLATDDDHDEEEETHDEQMRDADTVTPLLSPPRRHVPASSETRLKPSPVDLNLETLTYFHHFTTMTSLTLPSPVHPGSATHYWQTNVVSLALQRHWLMCGLLAVSASHSAAFADSTALAILHRERSAHFFSSFSAGWEETTKRDSVVVGTGDEEEAKNAGRQIRCMLHCAHWSLPDSKLDQCTIPELASPFELHSFITTIQSTITPNSTLPPGKIYSAPSNQDAPFAQATRILKSRTSPNTPISNASPSQATTPPALLNHLATLPSRMTYALGRPKNIQAVFATLSAIAALIECYNASLAADEAGATWCAMVTWLSKVPEHFKHMVSRDDPAALVVVAHWAVAVVQRAEGCGCWFLRGLGERIVLEVVGKLRGEDVAVRGLVGGLVGD